MKFTRLYSDGRPVRDQIKWKIVDAFVSGAYEQKGIEVPATWSQDAANILASKYFRKRGVPITTRNAQLDNVFTGPSFLYPQQPLLKTEFGSEISAHQVFHRLAGAWTYWGWCENLFSNVEEQAQIFYDEIYLMLAQQVAAPNSPQWFNTGLHWAYGIKGDPMRQWITDKHGILSPTTNTYERPQPHACFLTSIADDLVNEGGIMDAWVREAGIFKGGSGSGTNVSALRGEKEPLSGGGIASGPMSWLRIGDRAAGAIQSGGTTRRAALLRILNMDHPDIRKFCWWKVREEHKAACMYVGSQLIYDAYLLDNNNTAYCPPQVKDRIANGIIPEVFGIGWEGEAIDTVSGQNSNNSVRITDEFFSAVDNDRPWNLIRRTDGGISETIEARELWDDVCLAAWASADPGVMFHDTINSWNVSISDGEITTSNPCCEFHHLSGHPQYGSSACNLASIKLTSFLFENGAIDYIAYQHACRMWTVILDISVSMASFPAKEFALGAYNYRTLGLGYMDLGGLLMRTSIAYDSDEGRALASGLTALMTGVSYVTSAELAETLGPFPRWEANAKDMQRVMRNHARACNVIFSEYEDLNIEPVKYDKLRIPVDLQLAIEQSWAKVLGAQSFRNAQTTLLAPTGTISLVDDCDTSGIEPDFSLVKHKSLAGGGSMQIVNQAVEVGLKRLGYGTDINSALNHVDEYGTLVGWLKETDELAIFDCAVGTRSIRPMAHVEMVAAVQPFLSGAVSKTINMPADATVADVDKVYREAHRLGLKAVAVYRDGCKLTQPLSVAKPAEERESAPVIPISQSVSLLRARGVREYLPWRRQGGYTQKVKIGDQSVFLTINPYPDGRPAEMYIELSHEGSTLRALADLLAMSVSLGLQYGVPASEFVDRFCHTKFEPAGVVEGHDRISIVSSIGDYIGKEIGIEFLNREDLAEKRVTVAIDTGDRIVALDKRAIGVASGYTGDICRHCGNATMKRAGTCLTCDTCGETTGCG